MLRQWLCIPSGSLATVSTLCVPFYGFSQELMVHACQLVSFLPPLLDFPHIRIGKSDHWKSANCLGLFCLGLSALAFLSCWCLNCPGLPFWYKGLWSCYCFEGKLVLGYISWSTAEVIILSLYLVVLFWWIQSFLLSLSQWGDCRLFETKGHLFYVRDMPYLVPQFASQHLMCRISHLALHPPMQKLHEQ